MRTRNNNATRNAARAVAYRNDKLQRCIRYLASMIVLVAAVAFLCFPELSMAESSAPVVVVVGEYESSYHAVFVDALEAELAIASQRPEIFFIEAGQLDMDNLTQRPTILVTVGSKAARKVAELDTDVPVLHALIPASSFRSLYDAGGDGRKQVTALFIDQPIFRTVDLIRVALPEARTVTAILGPGSKHRQSELRQIAGASGLNLKAVTIERTAELADAMSRNLVVDDVLLTLPDEIVVNRDSAKSLVLGAYGRGIPYVGYSRALVKAGALMAVYSMPEQAGRETGEWLRNAGFFKFNRMPPPKYPRYFSVSVNYQIARALGVRLPEERTLERQLEEVRIHRE